MMELAKDGRWLGGNTPMGFVVQRVSTGSGKGKSAYSYLTSVPEEKQMVQRLYELFRTNRSIQTTAKQMNREGYRTPSGAQFNTSTTRLVLKIQFTVLPINAVMIILSTMMEMYLGIYLSLMVSMDYPFTTKPISQGKEQLNDL